MYETLESLGYEISEDHKLTGQVSYETMRAAIKGFFVDKNIKSKDTLLFYFSGHGVPEDNGEHYLATSEMNPEEPFDKGYSFEDLQRMINRSVSTRIVIILDCCYSGAAKAAKGGSGEEEATLGREAINNRIRSGEGKCVLASSLSYQKSYATKEGGYSLFTHYLIGGLKGNTDSVNNDGTVTPDSLGRYVYHKVTEKLPKQKPIRKVETSGDIILAEYPDLAKPYVQASSTTPLRKSRTIFVPIFLVAAILAIIFGINIAGITNFPINHQEVDKKLNVNDTNVLGKPPVFQIFDKKKDNLTVSFNSWAYSTNNLTSSSIDFGDGSKKNYNLTGQTNRNFEYFPEDQGYNGYPYTTQVSPNWVGPLTYHTYAKPGVYSIRIAVNDTGGQSNYTTWKVDLKEPSTSGIKVGPQPRAVEVDAKKGLVYVYNDSKNGSLSVINGTTNTVVNNIDLGYKSSLFPSSNPVSISINPNSSNIYVTNLDPDTDLDPVDDNITTFTTTVINGTTHRIVTAFNTSLSTPADSLDLIVYINPVTNMIYAMRTQGYTINGGTTLSIINGTTNSLIKTYNIRTDPGNPHLLYGNPLNNMVYLVNGTEGNDNRTLSIINGTTNSIISPVPLNDTSHPFLEKTTNRLYLFTTVNNEIINCRSVINASVCAQSLVIRDGYNGTQVDTIPISSNHNLLEYYQGVANSKTGKIYVTGFGDNVTVIDYKNRSKVLTIPVGWDPSDIAIDSKTNTIYITNYNSNTTSVINGNTDRRINIPSPPF